MGLWVRPAAMFCETIELDGEPIARFALERSEQSGDDDIHALHPHHAESKS